MNRTGQISVGSGGKQRLAPSRLEIEPVMVDRPWLTSALAAALSDPSCRIVLLNGQMGSGKSAFLAGWSAQNPDAMLYSIRKNSHERNRSGSANDLLSAVSEHFSSLYPALFESAGLSATIVQHVDQIAAGGSVVGVRIDELHALPFTSPAITVEQLITAAAGQMTALDIGQCVTDARLLGIETLQEIALFGPAVRAAEKDPNASLVIVIDALDELVAPGAGHSVSIINWLENCPPIPPAVRLIISSRPGRHVDTLRRIYADSLREIRFDDHPAEIADDITRYCRHILGGSSSNSGRERRRAQWIAELAAKAGRSFLFVVLLFRDFAAQGYLPGDDQADLPSLMSVPAELADLYELLLGKLRGRVADEPVRVIGSAAYASAWSEIYEPVLGVLAAAAEPLTVERIGAFANIRASVRVVREALAKMATLLSVEMTGGSRSYALLHLSLAQHLTGETCFRSDFMLDISEWHAQIAASLWQGTGEPWLDDQDLYRVRHIATHLRGCLPAGKEVEERLLALLQDPAFVAREIEVAGVFATMADIAASLPLVQAGPHRQSLEDLHDILSLNQAALWAGADPLSSIANGLLAEDAGSAIAAEALRLAGMRACPYFRLAQVVRIPRPPARRQLGGSLGSVVDCAVDAHADLVLTAGMDGLIRLWNRRAERVVRILRAGDMPCSCAISADGALLIGGYADGVTAVWLDGDEPVFADRMDSAVTGVAINSADLLAAARLDGTLTAWQFDRDGGSGRELWTVELDDPLHCCAVAESGVVVAGDGAGALHVVSAAGATRIQAHLAPVRACAVYPDGSRAITGSYDGTLAVWELATGARHATLTGHDSAILGCSLARAGRLVVSASLDGRCGLWEPDQGRQLGMWAPHDDHVTCCAVDDGGRLLVTGSADETVRYWPVPAGLTGVGAESRHHGEVMQCALAATGRALLSAATDMSVRQWQADDLQAPPNLLVQLNTPITALAVNADASMVAVGTAQGELILGRDGRWEIVRSGAAMVTSCVLTGDGQTALVGDEAGGIELWRMSPAVRRIAMPDAHDDWVLYCGADAAGNVGLSVDNGECSLARCWDLNTGLPLSSFRLPGTASTCRLSSDGLLVASALVDGRILIQDRSGALLRAHSEPPADRVLAIAASPGGARHMTVTRSGRLSHWTHDQLDATLFVHPPSAVFISDDLRNLIVGHSQGDIATYQFNSAARKI